MAEASDPQAVFRYDGGTLVLSAQAGEAFARVCGHVPSIYPPPRAFLANQERIAHFVGSYGSLLAEADRGELQGLAERVGDGEAELTWTGGAG